MTFYIFLFIVLVFIINPAILYRMFDTLDLILTCCVDIATNTVGLVLDVYRGVLSRCRTIRKVWKLWMKGNLTIKSIQEYYWISTRMYVMYLIRYWA